MCRIGAIYCTLILIKAPGKEQQGQCYVLVLTLSAFNRFGLALVAPITQSDQFAHENGFTVSMKATGSKIQGVVLCNQVRMLDFKQASGKVVEGAQEIIIDDVLARVRALVD